MNTRTANTAAADAAWAATNRTYLDRADRHIAAGEGIAATLAMAAYLRQETLRRRQRAIDVEHGRYDGWTVPLTDRPHERTA